MKKVYESGSLSEAHFLISFLDERGISAFIQGENLVALRGELPGNTYPEIWIKDDSVFEDARKIILDEYEKRVPAPGEDPWKCACGEMIEGQFAACWHCGSVESIA